MPGPQGRGRAGLRQLRGGGRAVATWRGRREDPALLRGAGRYVADLSVDGCLELAFARSYEAHGVLLGVDVGASRTVAGVVGSWSAADLPDLPLTPPTVANAAAAVGRERPSLAVDRVRFVGEPLAAVVAESRYLAEDGVDEIVADIDPLPVLGDPAAATAPGASTLFAGASNIATELTVGTDVTDVLASCPVVVERHYVNPRVAHSPLEGRAVLVVPEGGRVTVWCSHQAPHRLLDGLRFAFPHLGEDGIRVRVPDVGGAFGQKSHTYPEYVVAVHLALLLGRPVRWIEDRWEGLTGSAHGRDQHQWIRLGSDRQGRIQAAEVRIDGDIGAYPHVGAYVPGFGGLVLSGPYAIPYLSGHFRSVLTNKAPTCPYRGAGRPEAAYVLDRAVDALAHQLGLDPAEVRFRNFVDPSAFPYTSATGAVYESGDYGAALRQALDLVDYDGARAEQDRRRRSAGAAPLGVGLCSFIERSGGAGTSNEFASVQVRPDGSVRCRVGTTSTGQGHQTAFAAIVADVLGVPAASVAVQEGDTDEVPEGTGSFASRSMQVGGSALHVAAERCLAVLRAEAAAVLDVDPREVGWDGTWFSAGDRRLSLAEAATAAGGVREDAEFWSPTAFPSGSYAAVVEVDVETGAVTVLRLAAVDDCGIRREPMLVEGQTLGSSIQGLGQALYEAFVYQEDGQPVTATLMDYLLPTASELPDIRTGFVESPNPHNPLGAKGAGEGGSIGVPPAVLNAVLDALRPLGVEEIQMPATPGRVWEALR